MNAVLELFLNAVMAFPARCRHVVDVDGRRRIVVRQHPVRGVAIGAHGRDHESALQQAFAVNALRVSFHDLGFRAGVAGSGLLPLAMTPRAQHRNIGRKCRRGRLGLALHPVRAVTLDARGRIEIFFREQLSMRAFLVLLHKFGVAGGAIDFLSDRFTRTQPRRAYSRVALTARLLYVPRTAQFRPIDKKGPPVFRGLDVLALVTAQAVLIGHSLVVKNLPDLMGLMAVHTGRKNMRLLLPQLALDDLPVHRFDLGMALSAGARDVFPRNRGVGIRVRQNPVRRVAGHASRGDDQPFLHQRRAVHAFGVVFNDVRFVDLALPLDRSPFLMAFAADIGNLRRRHRGVRVLYRQDIVEAMAVFAARRQRVAARDRLAVQGCAVLFLLIRMAAAAIDFCQLPFVRQLLVLQVRMAIDAGERTMNRIGILLAIHVEGNNLAIALGGQILAVVTCQAILRLLRGSPDREEAACPSTATEKFSIS